MKFGGFWYKGEKAYINLNNKDIEIDYEVRDYIKRLLDEIEELEYELKELED